MRHVPFSFIFLLMLLILTEGCLTSCSSDLSDKEDGSTLSSDFIRFSLSQKTLTGLSTRSSLNEIDNKIDYEQLRVVCFDSDDNIVGIYTPGMLSESNHLFVVKTEKRDEISSISVLANWEGYGLEPGEAKNREELKSLSGEYRGEPTLIPMYGEGKLPEGPEESVMVEMSRSLAKIEVRDRLEEYEIESVTIREYGAEIIVDGRNAYSVASAPLQFLHDEDNNSFYLYLPAIDLGETDSERRKIEVVVRDKSGMEEEDQTYLLYLKDYGMDGNDAESWSQLCCNNLYSFNVEAIDSPTPPEQQTTGKLQIRWWPALYGKFALVQYLNRYDDVKLLLKNNDSEKVTVLSPEADWHNELSDGFAELYVDIDLGKHSLVMENLQYCLVDMASPGETLPEKRWNDEFAGNLFEDACYVETTEEKPAVVHLTSIPILYLNGAANKIERFPNDLKYRFYWRNQNLSSISSFRLYNTSTKNWATLAKSKLRYGSENTYKYIEYSLSDYASLTISYKRIILQDDEGNTFDFIDAPQTQKEGLMSRDFFIKNINGVDYYVFYLN